MLIRFTLDSEFLSSPLRVTLESPQAQGHFNVIPASSRSSQTHHHSHVKVSSGVSLYYQPWLYPKLRVNSVACGHPSPGSFQPHTQFLSSFLSSSWVSPNCGHFCLPPQSHHQVLMLQGWCRDLGVAPVGQPPSRLPCQAVHPHSTVQV